MNITAYDLAERFVGIAEAPGATNNPAVLAMLRLDGDWPEGDDVPWCSAFVNYIAWLLRLPRSRSLMARSWLKVGRSIDLEDAKPGFDVVVLWRVDKASVSGHVGFYAGRGIGGGINILGGNQSNEVNVSNFPIDRLLGVRRLVG